MSSVAGDRAASIGHLHKGDIHRGKAAIIVFDHHIIRRGKIDGLHWRPSLKGLCCWAHVVQIPQNQHSPCPMAVLLFSFTERLVEIDLRFHWFFR
jgi:hypothetical protein